MANLIRTCKWCGDRYSDNTIVSAAPMWFSPIRTILNLTGVVSNRYKYCSTKCYYNDPRNASLQIEETKETKEKNQKIDSSIENNNPKPNPISNLESHQNQINQLKHLKQLLDNRILTQNEFEQQKNKILSE